MKTRAFVYVATGEGYQAEAFASAQSLRGCHPDATIELITDVPAEVAGPFSAVRMAAGEVLHTPADKMLAIESPHDEVIFLDSDTHAADDLTPVFELLSRFDIAALQDVNRGWYYELPGVPSAFAELNTGVLAFRRTARVLEFFKAWRLQYGRLRSERGFVTDQPAFRQALFESDLRLAPLPSEFHFLGDFPNCLSWHARLIHGRNDHVRVAREVNSDPVLRAYLPHLGALRAYTGRRAALGQLWSMVRKTCVLLVAGPPAMRNKPLSWWKIEEKEKAAVCEGRTR
jgi:hypothetical protein